MKEKKKSSMEYKNLAFYGVVAIALVVIIGYYILNPKPQTQNTQTQSIAQTVDKVAEVPKQNDNQQTVSVDSATQSAKPEPTVKPAESQPPKDVAKTEPTSSKTTTTSEQTQTQKEDPKPEPTAKPEEAAIKILKSEVTAQAKFYPYKLDGVKMEVIAVKATDGTIRTALNTCQVCYDSERGYYEQVGAYLVCQNCGNKFHIDQVEKVKGGCNPVPVMAENKKDTGDYILISKDYLASQKEFFSNWKK